MPAKVENSFTINSAEKDVPDAVRTMPKRTRRTRIAGRHVRNSRVLHYAFALRKALSLDGHLPTATGLLEGFGGSRV